jgi:prepilin-type N-terminal cleavage/methylation domain-containing protein
MLLIVREGHLPVRRKVGSLSGMTLIELLVVLAIIAGLAGLVYPAIMDSIKKSEASMAAQRIDVIEKAKVQYRLDNVDSQSNTLSDTTELGLPELGPYLTRFGQAITQKEDLNKGTGGVITIHSLSTRASFEPGSTDAKFKALLIQYGVLPSDSSSNSGTSSP